MPAPIEIRLASTTAVPAASTASTATETTVAAETTTATTTARSQITSPHPTIHCSHPSTAALLNQHDSYQVNTNAFEFDSNFGRLQSPSLAENTHAREVETAFCRDFYCCGLRLLDLHDLLQHYEECHVYFQDDGDLDITEDESDFLDEEDDWSDSDSLPSSPSSASSSGPASDRLDGATATDSEQKATVKHLYPSVLQSHYPQPLGPRSNSSLPQHHPVIHSTHPLYRHPSSNNNSSDVNCSVRNPTTQALQFFSTSFNGPTKRKASGSLTDIYADDDDNPSQDISSSTLPDMIARTSICRSHTDPDFHRHMKRPAIESNQRSVVDSSHSNTQHSLEMNSGARPFLFSNGQPNNGPSETRQGALHPTTLHTLAGRHGMMGHSPRQNGPPYIPSSADISRQRDEVYSLMENLTQSGNGNMADKPYRCNVLGCDKSYKNPNGLKYHNLHGHCSTGGMCDADSPESKPYVCTFLECGKRYKNLNGLKYHIEHSHPSLTAALRAHQSGLINPQIFGPYSNQTAMTIAAALQAVNSSPMMMAAANAIMTAQAVMAASAANTNSNGEPGTGTGTEPQIPRSSDPRLSGNTRLASETEVGPPPELNDSGFDFAGLISRPRPEFYINEASSEGKNQNGFVKPTESLMSAISVIQNGVQVPTFAAASAVPKIVQP
ncbi:hypothetical protein BGZ46_007184 [Entomortierella lignicola]|nr:hypothetical protein BGZ46_007184 [Entomortierella lignicola]